ncbi:hypothetical protein E2C01_005408 [Portunus trituberculatus]|uniref:Uncharacterized protein n=1 Tax=Portunus trituberculatus TaxID=210409 RepID=A0A5B7CSQ0_PORTR|nr:hypothetical protein [Portunus trituberculatus]
MKENNTRGTCGQYSPRQVNTTTTSTHNQIICTLTWLLKLLTPEKVRVMGVALSPSLILLALSSRAALALGDGVLCVKVGHKQREV